MTKLDERTRLVEFRVESVRVELVGRSLHRRVLHLAAIVVGLGGATGCGGYAITATNGAVFADSSNPRAELTSALLASASRDLDCTSAVEVRRLDAERQYEVIGCGFRALYDVETPSIRERRVALVSSDRPGASETPVASTTESSTKLHAVGALEHERPVAAKAAE